MDVKEIPIDKSVVGNARHILYKYSYEHTDLVPKYEERAVFRCRLCGFDHTVAKEMREHLATKHRKVTRLVSCGYMPKDELAEFISKGGNYKEFPFDNKCPHCHKEIRGIMRCVNHIRHAHVGGFDEFREWEKLAEKSFKITDNFLYMNREHQIADTGYYKLVSVFPPNIVEVILDDMTEAEHLMGITSMNEYMDVINTSNTGLARTQEKFEEVLNKMGTDILGLPKNDISVSGLQSP